MPRSRGESSPRPRMNPAQAIKTNPGHRALLSSVPVNRDVNIQGRIADRVRQADPQGLARHIDKERALIRNLAEPRDFVAHPEGDVMAISQHLSAAHAHLFISRNIKGTNDARPPVHSNRSETPPDDRFLWAGGGGSPMSTIRRTGLPRQRNFRLVLCPAIDNNRRRARQVGWHEPSEPSEAL